MAYYSFHNENFPFKFYFIVFWGGVCKGREELQSDGGMSGIEMHHVQDTKRKLINKNKKNNWCKELFHNQMN